MNVHPDNCKLIAIIIKSLVYTLPFYEHFYALNSKVLNYETSEKDLGVIINSRLSWNIQCECLVQKANQQLGLDLVTLSKTLNKDTLFISLVRSMF